MERQLIHSAGEAEKFYRELARRGVGVRVGIEATGYSRWFERLLAELGMELWIGDAAKIKTKRVRKQKTDREDARLLLRLLRENNFPRIWVPSPENRDLRQLLWHRHRLVQMRTRIMNPLQALAMNEGASDGRKSAVERSRARTAGKAPSARTVGIAAPERSAGAAGPDEDPSIEELTAAIEQEARSGPGAAAHDASWCGPADGAGLRADHRDCGTISVRQADR